VVDSCDRTFFSEPTAASLTDAVRRFGNPHLDTRPFGHHAQQFDTSVFKEKIGAWVTQVEGDCDQDTVHSPTVR